MTSDAAILELVRGAFSDCPKPEHFTTYKHCPECKDHDELLRARDVESLSIEDVGNAGWDPLCGISPEGFAYFFPALARLVLAEPAEPFGWYGPQLLFHLTCDGQSNRYLLHFTPEQKATVTRLLRHIGETRQTWLSDAWPVHGIQTAE